MTMEIKQRSMGISMRVSIDSIKAELGKGEVVTRGRQNGKTAALLEFVHEHDSGHVIIIVCNWSQRAHTSHRYRELYPNDAQPIVVCIQNVSDADVVGTSRKWVTDEVWPDAVKERAGAYEALDYFGGVGTPMCMDMHR